MRNLGILLLGLWLLITSLLSLLSIQNEIVNLALVVLAIVAGVLFLVDGIRAGRGLPNNIGIILLGIWLVAFGILPLLNVPRSGILLDVLGIVAGIVILLRR